MNRETIIPFNADDGMPLQLINVHGHVLQRHSPARRHELHKIPDYGHLDTVTGKPAHRDVFPLILSSLGEK